MILRDCANSKTDLEFNFHFQLQHEPDLTLALCKLTRACAVCVSFSALMPRGLLCKMTGLKFYKFRISLAVLCNLTHTCACNFTQQFCRLLAFSANNIELANTVAYYCDELPIWVLLDYIIMKII
jgi:hypothetical protein